MLRCLMGQPATGASDPGLHLVEDQQSAGIVGDPAGVGLGPKPRGQKIRHA